MITRHYWTISMLAFAALVGGCADGNNLLTTASVAPEKIAVAPKIDPACIALSNQIDALRKDGAVERLEKASAGKSASVQVKRASLAKQAELNKANADFQTKCGPQIPQAQTAQISPQPAVAATAPQIKAAAANTAQTAVATAPKN
jgi:hypothetical protein